MGFLINENKYFYFVVNNCHHRTGATIGKTVGVITAKDEDEARAKIDSQYVGIYNTLNVIHEFDPAEGFAYTTYNHN